MITTEAAKEEDLVLLFSLNKDLIDRYEDLASIDYPRVLNWVEENLRASLPHFRRVLHKGCPAGFFCLIPGEKWELDSLFVLPEFQNRGIGTEILKYAIKESGGNLFFYVFKENHDALRLYKRMGFEIAKTLPGRYILEYKKACRRAGS